MFHMRAALLLALGVLAPISAPASDEIIGDNTAHACFEASQSLRKDREALHTCDIALEGNALQGADRGGALVNRGVIRMRRGELAAAQSDFDAGIALVPTVGEGWFNRGAVFIGEHRYKEALSDLDKAITLGVHEPAKAYYYRGLAHEYLDDQTAAYQDYKQAQTLAPDWDLPAHELKRFSVTRR
jgi:tetratricopeptide (TPR) repeat protein